MKVKGNDFGIFQWVLVFLFGILTSTASAQVYLYLEDMTKVKAIKIGEGSRISIKTKDYPEWTSYTIDRLLVDSKTIVFTDGMIDLEDVTHLRIKRRWVAAIGSSLERFGIGWGLYGTIALAASISDVEPRVVLVGTVIPLVMGWVMKKLWLWKKYKIGQKNRLKILDLSFPDNPYGERTRKIFTP